MTRSSAPGKVILFGEHAVVYGRPAIAVPVTQVSATATVSEGRASSARCAPGVTVCAPDIGCMLDVAAAPADEPLSTTVRNTLTEVGLSLADVCLEIRVESTIPVASGLGSGAAVATAVVRALSTHLGRPLDTPTVSRLVYETERIHHGTPSGIDNTVVAFVRPVYFRRGAPIEVLQVRSPFWLAVGDTGVPGLTREAVADVRARHAREGARCESIFYRIAALVGAAREAIEGGRVEALGPLMDENQELLRQLDVSSPELERLIAAALAAGAQGAKLSGGGRGGNMIALVTPEDAERVRDALLAAGAKRALVTKVGEHGSA